MFNFATTLFFSAIFFILGDVFGINGITTAFQQIISHF